ncbi:NAD(P)-dependent oxidoreductase, partial [Phenylobacterium sp.]|uniref:NAD-dependent epimerase/dehydratase family protein n=1 Tax=Phenylobacterium sp. TaxID=1871053 RepID=UPI002736CFB7
MAAGLVAVTGATGFLGRHLVRELATSGWTVRILARRDVIHPLWRDLEVEVVLGDLADAGALDRLSRDADLVVHCAGLTKAWTAEAFNAVNVEGARRVAERTTGRMLLVSSLTAREPTLSDYAASKRGGEDAARTVLGDRITIVRPPALYGPDDPETLPLFKLAASSPVLPLLDPRARIAMMHVQDAARQIAALAKLTGAHVVSLADRRPDGYSWREVLQTAADTFGRKPKFVKIPQLALTAVAAAGRLASRSGPAPMLSFGKVRE